MRDQTDHTGMPRRQFVKQLGAAGAALAAGPTTGLFAQQATPRRPNIIFLLADDMRWDAMGCMGNRFVRTPHLDRLAAQGVLFENAFVTTSICAPNRACILAGQHQRTTGIKDFSTPFEPAALDQTYPVLLRNAGYRKGVRTERWKYVRYLDTDPNCEQLFDLGSDPDELSNLAGDPAHEAVLNRLRERLLHYRRTLADNNPEPQEYGHFRTVALSAERGDTAHDLGACQSLGQTFLAEGVKLHSLRFRTPTWGKKPAPCGLIVELLADGPRGKLLSTQTVAKQWMGRLRSRSPAATPRPARRLGP